MAIFDALIDDIGARFGLGSNAGPLVREILAMVTGSPGGIGGFLNTIKSGGLASDLGSWLGNANATPLAPQQIERVRDREPPRPRVNDRVDSGRLRAAE